MGDLGLKEAVKSSLPSLGRGGSDCGEACWGKGRTGLFSSLFFAIRLCKLDQQLYGLRVP